MKSGNPNFLEPSGPLQAGNGTALQRNIPEHPNPQNYITLPGNKSWSSCPNPMHYTKWVFLPPLTIINITKLSGVKIQLIQDEWLSRKVIRSHLQCKAAKIQCSLYLWNTKPFPCYNWPACSFLVWQLTAAWWMRNK